MSAQGGAGQDGSACFYSGEPVTVMTISCDRPKYIGDHAENVREYTDKSLHYWVGRDSRRMLWAEDEGSWWARGHGPDVEAALRLVWSVRR